MFFVSVLSLLVGSEQIMNRQILNGVGCRYSFAAISIWLILVFSCISKLLACISKLFVSVSDTSGDIPRKLVAAVLMMCIVLIPYRQLPINTGSPDIWKNVEKYMCSGSGTTCWISVPPIWTYGIDVPIQTDIFEAEPSNYMLYAVDAIDGKSTAEIQESGLRIQGQPVLWVQGWAMESNKPGTVLLEANGKYVAAQPVNRIDVAEYFGIAVEKDTFNVGYIAYIPVHYLQVGENEINLVLISKDDSHCNKVPFTVSIHSIE